MRRRVSPVQAAGGGDRSPTPNSMKKNIELTRDIETLFGTRDENLHVLEDGLNINIDLRSDRIELEAAPRDVARAEQMFADYEHLRTTGHQFATCDLSSMLRLVALDPNA